MQGHDILCSSTRLAGSCGITAYSEVTCCSSLTVTSTSHCRIRCTQEHWIGVGVQKRKEGGDLLRRLELGQVQICSDVPLQATLLACFFECLKVGSCIPCLRDTTFSALKEIAYIQDWWTHFHKSNRSILRGLQDGNKRLVPSNKVARTFSTDELGGIIDLVSLLMLCFLGHVGVQEDVAKSPQ